MKKKLNGLKTRWGMSVLTILVCGLSILLMLIYFNIYTEKEMEKFVRSNMNEVNQAAVLAMGRNFESFIGLLEQQSKIISMMESPSDEEIMDMLVRFAGEEDYKNAAIVTYSGKIYSSYRGITQATKKDAMPNLMKRGTVVSQPRIFFDDSLVIDISTPTYLNGVEVGKLVVSVASEKIGEMFPNNFFKGDAALNLVTQDGTVIARISGRESPLKPLSNVFDFYSEEGVAFLEGTAEDLAYAMSVGDQVWAKYLYQEEVVGVSYMPFGRNGWYMAIATTGATLYAQSNAVRDSVLVLTLCIMSVVGVACVMVVVQRVEEQKRLDALKNTYSIAIKKTNDLFYEADIENDMFVDYSEKADKTIWKDPPKNYSNALIQVANICAPECREQFLATFLPQNIKIKMEEGISSINFEYKIKPDEHTERWLSATFVPVDDGSGTKLICMENDITEQKMRQESLKKSAIMDGLTGLYNRKTTKESIDWFLKNEGQVGEHALALIDIDHFKQVNDVLGHLAGDMVLAEFGQSMRNIFRKSDILGRIGGDEFVVFLKDYGVVELVMAKLNEVLEDAKREHCLEGDSSKSVSTAASIGVAIYNKDGCTFDVLYQAADVALYASKKTGRDKYTFFSQEMIVPPAQKPTQPPAQMSDETTER